MLPHVAPSVARHARMFELIRQSQQAALTSERLSSAKAQPADDAALEDWCTAAVQSLQLQGAARRV